MPFNLNTNVHLTKDDGGIVRALEHLQQSFRSVTGLTQTNPSRLGEDYLRKVAEFPNPGSVTSIRQFQMFLLMTAFALHSPKEKSPLQASIISYYQTLLGLPIWEPGFSVTVLSEPLRGTSFISSVNYAVKVDKPSSK